MKWTRSHDAKNSRCLRADEVRNGFGKRNTGLGTIGIASGWLYTRLRCMGLSVEVEHRRLLCDPLRLSTDSHCSCSAVTGRASGLDVFRKSEETPLTLQERRRLCELLGLLFSLRIPADTMHSNSAGVNHRARGIIGLRHQQAIMLSLLCPRGCTGLRGNVEDESGGPSGPEVPAHRQSHQQLNQQVGSEAKRKFYKDVKAPF